MTTEFVPYDRVLKLKELGFDEPTFPQAFRWFSDNYKPEELNFYIHLLNTNSTPKNYSPCYSYTIRRGVNVIEVATSDTYEEAELACLDKLIEIIEKFNNK
jgi:hypothetical protein